MAQLNAGRIGPPKSGRKRAGEGGGKQFFSMYAPPGIPLGPLFVDPAMSLLCVF